MAPRKPIATPRLDARKQARATSRGPEGHGRGGSVGARLTALEDEVAVLRGALADLLHAKPGPTVEPDFTLYGVGVILAPDVTPQRITAAIDDLPPGLSSDAVITRLERKKLLVRTAK